MPGSVPDLELLIPELDDLPVLEFAVGARLLRHLQAERASLLRGGLVKGRIVRMKVHGRPRRILDVIDGADVVEMSVREQDELDAGVFGLSGGQEALALSAWIYDGAAPGPLADGQICV